jgi:ureidoglycolate hydrolase
MSKEVMAKNLGLIQKYFKMAKVDTDITYIGVLSNLFRPSLYQVVPLISILRL